MGLRGEFGGGNVIFIVILFCIILILICACIISIIKNQFSKKGNERDGINRSQYDLMNLTFFPGY